MDVSEILLSNASDQVLYRKLCNAQGIADHYTRTIREQLIMFYHILYTLLILSI